MSAEPQMALTFVSILALLGGVVVVGAVVGLVIMLSGKKE
jgi:hypothetical protein